MKATPMPSRLIAFLFAFVAGAVPLFAADNPTPCYDPWRCDREPSATISWSGSGPGIKVCPGTTGSWSTTTSWNDGLKKRCEEEAPVGIKDRSTTWVIGGPETASGSGNSATFTPQKCGDHTIQFTSRGKAEEPCQADIVTQTDNGTFQVPCETCTATTLADRTACPGECIDVPVFITNPDPDCTFTYTYMTAPGAGTAAITFTGSGSVTVGPMSSETVWIKACADAAAALGQRSFVTSFYGTFNPGLSCQVTGAVKVGTDWSIAKDSDISICVGQGVDAKFLVTNNGNCAVKVQWAASKIAGRPILTFVPPSGETTVPPGGTAPIIFKVSAAGNSPGGNATVQVTATDQYGTQKVATLSAGVLKVTGVTHNKPLLKKWVEGERAIARLQYEGSLANVDITYELYDVDAGRVVWSVITDQPVVNVPIAEPGRYTIRAKACGDTFAASPTFVCFTARFHGPLVFKWDKTDDFLGIFTEADSVIARIVSTADAASNIHEVLDAKGGAGEANLNARQRALDASAESADGFLRDINQRAQVATRAQAAAEADLAAKLVEKTGLERHMEFLRRRLRELEGLPSPSDRVLQLIRDLRVELDAASGMLSVLNDAIAALNQRLATLAQSLTEFAEIRTMIRETKASLVEASQKAAEELGRNSRFVRPKVDAVKAADQAAKLKMQNLAVKMARFGWSRGIPFIGFVVDVFQWSQFDDAREELERQLRELDELNRRYHEIIKNLKADRIQPTLKQDLKITTDPGRITFELKEEPGTWVTQDDISGSDAEGAWDWNHLVLLDGDVSAYSRAHVTSSGPTGEWTGSFHAYGNLANSFITGTTIGSDRVLMGATQVRSVGATEEQMVRLAEAKDREYVAKWREINRKLEVIATSISIGLGLGALALLAVGSALAGPVIIIAAVIAVAKLVWDLIFYFFFDTELMKSLKFQYPEEL